MTWSDCPDHAGMVTKELMAEKAAVEGTIMIRDRADLIKAVTITLQNKE